MFQIPFMFYNKKIKAGIVARLVNDVYYSLEYHLVSKVVLYKLKVRTKRLLHFSTTAGFQFSSVYFDSGPSSHQVLDQSHPSISPFTRL